MRFERLGWVTILLVIAAAACSHQVGTKAILDPSKTSSIVVGQSSKAEVLRSLGPPRRADRNGQGESWVYRIEGRDTNERQIAAGAQVVSAAVGALVPFGGLVGAGIGLAGTGLRGSEKEMPAAVLTVDFGTQGVVRECTFSTNVVSVATASNPDPASQMPLDCQRPPPAALP